MRIYHGSTVIIKEPILKRGKVNNDYGQGFYCTQNIELAKEWACKDNDDGYVNIYDLDLSNLKVLDLTTDNHYVIEWISILIQHRAFETKGQIAQLAKEYILSHFYINTSDYDVIIGYRADDSYFTYAQAFLNNTLSLESLKNAMKLGDLGTQVAVLTDKAIKQLKYIGNDYKKKSLLSRCFHNRLYYIHYRQEGLKPSL